MIRIFWSVGSAMEKMIQQKYLEGRINRELIIWGVKYRVKSKVNQRFIGGGGHCQFVVLPKKEVYSQVSLVLSTPLSRVFFEFPSRKHFGLQKPLFLIHSHVRRICPTPNVENTSWQEWMRAADNLTRFFHICWLIRSGLGEIQD